jgi:hypothetical protein
MLWMGFLQSTKEDVKLSNFNLNYLKANHVPKRLRTLATSLAKTEVGIAARCRNPLILLVRPPGIEHRIFGYRSFCPSRAVARQRIESLHDM